MELLSGLNVGAAIALTPSNLMYCFVGCLFGTLVGVLPGLGALTTIALLLPLTYGLPAETAIIMLAGIYYGAQYGGSTTAILVNIPGEASALVTVIDGHKLARRGRAGAALAIAALGSFFAGTFATLVIAVSAAQLVAVALRFGPVEYFSLMVFGLVGSIVLASGSLLRALGVIVFGLLLGTVGTDITSGVQRFTFGSQVLTDGLNFAVMAMGMFGLAEIVANLGRSKDKEFSVAAVGDMYPTRDEFRRSVWPSVRGTAIGSLLGLLPGGGSILASFASYAAEKRLSKRPHEFGEGAIEGVAGPESANNAGAQTSFIPLLTLGIPSNPVMALMIGAMMMQGVVPGPQVMGSNPQLFWAIVVSMWIGNVILVILNLPLVGLWVKLLSIQYKFIFPMILILCCIGSYSLSNSADLIWQLVIFGLIGTIAISLRCELAPFLLAFVLGPMMEENLGRALLLTRGDWTVFITRPVSAVLLLLSAVLLLLVARSTFKAKRAAIFAE